MYKTQTSHGTDSVTGTQLMGERAQRLLVLLGLVAVLSLLFVMPAAAQLDLCNAVNGTTFGDYITAIIEVIVYAGIIVGTIAIVMGFASEAFSFIDAGDMQNYRKKGLIYGWGLPVFLYGLQIMGSVIGLGVDCLFPI